jgi:hypothetical protein
MSGDNLENKSSQVAIKRECPIVGMEPKYRP